MVFPELDLITAFRMLPSGLFGEQTSSMHSPPANVLASPAQR